MAVFGRVVVWLMVRVSRTIVVYRMVTVVMSIRGGIQEGVKVLTAVEASPVIGLKRIIGVPPMELVT